MSTVDCFEDLKVWQKARDLCKIVHGFTLHDHFAKDFRLVGQIKASSGSVMDNIAEGFERDGNKEFTQFLSVSKGSSGETRSQLYRALDNGYISQSEFDMAYEKSLECSKMLKGLIIYLKESELKGNKFKDNNHP
ncbi:MAG TPA: four helix bundle protein [Prolixibacteraceae bacterium]|nr:four helix bundle protein [Prolixibacteraceae bacterium]